MRTGQTHSAESTKRARPHLTPEQHELLKSALGRVPDDCIRDEARPVIREIVNTFEHADRPEQVLVAFKTSLNEAADGARIPFGPERSHRLSGLVSAFIEEMFARAPIIRDGECRGK